MKRGEIIAALGELENDSANIRGWLDAVDAKIVALRERLAESSETPPRPETVEYDRTLLDGPPRPIPNCDCGSPASYKTGTSATGKPWAAYFCALRKDDPNNCGFKQWVK